MAEERMKPQDEYEGGAGYDYATKILLVIPEEIVTHLAVAEHLLGGDRDDDGEAALELRIEEAAQEIAQALVETGRPLRHFHLLREALDRRGARRGYREGAQAVASVVAAFARDPKEVGGSKPTS